MPTTVKTTSPGASLSMVWASRRSASFGMRQPSRKSSGGSRSRKKIAESSTTELSPVKGMAAPSPGTEPDLHQRQRHARGARHEVADHDGQQGKQNDAGGCHVISGLSSTQHTRAALAPHANTLLEGPLPPRSARPVNPFGSRPVRRVWTPVCRWRWHARCGRAAPACFPSRPSSGRG